MNRIIKIIKAITLSFVATFAVLLIEPVRIFTGMAAFIIFAMLIIDTWKNLLKLRRDNNAEQSDFNGQTCNRPRT